MTVGSVVVVEADMPEQLAHDGRPGVVPLDPDAQRFYQKG